MSKKLLTILVIAMVIAGCGSGGGGGSSSSGITPLATADSKTLISSYPVSGSLAETGTQTFTNPEPSTLALLGIGLAGLVGLALRKKEK